MVGLNTLGCTYVETGMLVVACNSAAYGDIEVSISAASK